MPVQKNLHLQRRRRKGHPKYGPGLWLAVSAHRLRHHCQDIKEDEEEEEKEEELGFYNVLLIRVYVCVCVLTCMAAFVTGTFV